jgi:class 3 adenylate cyclase
MAEPGPVDRPRSAPTAGPSGPASGDAAGVTRGFLFADLRDYTSYVDAHGDRAGAALLERYRSLVRAAVTAAGGAEIRTEGDSFYVVFGSVSAAIRAGIAIVGAAAATAAEPDPIRVGVGVHAGETTETPEGFVGSAVNIAARLCAQAKAGELVVSDTVRNITRTQIDVEFQPLGLRRLKGLSEPITCYRVVPEATDRARSRAAGLPRTRLVAGALAVAVVVVTAGAAVALIGGGHAVTPTAAASAAALAIPSPSAVGSASTGPVASPSPGPFPTAAEAAILAALPSTLDQSCVRGGTIADARLAGFTGTVSSKTGGSRAIVSVTPNGSRGGITCHPATGATRLYVIEPTNPTSPHGTMVTPAFGDEYLGFLTAYHHLPFGSCATDTKAYELWSGPSGGGTLACMNPYDGRPWIYFSFDRGRYFGFATREDSNYAALYQWWEQLKTFLP